MSTRMCAISCDYLWFTNFVQERNSYILPRSVFWFGIASVVCGEQAVLYFACCTHADGGCCATRLADVLELVPVRSIFSKGAKSIKNALSLTLHNAPMPEFLY